MTKKTAIPAGKLIPANEILSHIKKLGTEALDQERHMHQVAISCFAIAARDGQISPLNKFNSILRPPIQAALKAYALAHCKAWLTMKEGEYRVKPETMDARHDFSQVAEELLEVTFFDRPKDVAERSPWKISEPLIVKAVSGLLRRVEKASSPDIHEDVVALIRQFRDRLESLVNRHMRPARGRGRPRKETIAMPPKRRGRPAKNAAKRA